MTVEFERIKVALYQKLPSELQPQADALARLLVDVSQGSISPKAGEAQIAAQADMVHLLETLQGQKIETPHSTLTFGHNNEFADVSIRDVAGRDIVTLTVNINYLHTKNSNYFQKMLTVFNKNKVTVSFLLVIVGFIALVFLLIALSPTQKNPLDLTPTALEKRLDELNIVLTVGSPEEMVRARSFLETEEYQAIAKKIIEIMGTRRFKEPLQLDTIVGWHRINLNGASNIIIEDVTNLGDVETSIINHWNELYGETVTSLDQITEPILNT